MAKMTEEQRAGRSRTRKMREAVESERQDHRHSEMQKRWDREGTRLTRAEVESGEPCRSCGRKIKDNLGSWGPSNSWSPEDRIADAEETRIHKSLHPDCNAIRWTYGGSRTAHCGLCCPPPGLSQKQIDTIGTILRRSSKITPADLREWTLELTCGHNVVKSQHKSHISWTSAVVDCELCSTRRGVIAVTASAAEPDPASIHSPESTSINRLADTEAEIARLTAELKAAKARHRAMTQNS